MGSGAFCACVSVTILVDKARSLGVVEPDFEISRGIPLRGVIDFLLAPLLAGASLSWTCPHSVISTIENGLPGGAPRGVVDPDLD